MNKELIESITRMVVERLSIEERKHEATVKLRSTEASGETIIAKPEEAKPHSLITIKPLQNEASKRQGTSSVKNKESPRKLKRDEEESLKKEQQLEDLKKKTPARIAVGRTGFGSRPKADTWLKFRFDHAAAVDAVYGEVSTSILEKLKLFTVETKVKDKEAYIRRPDLGRQLSEEAIALINERCEKSPIVQVVVSNGLSASAVETNLEDVYLSLQQSLNSLNIQMGTTFYVNKGRVAVMDEIGEVLTPEVIVLLIGERPGLISAESLSAYLCYKPSKGTIEADRMVVSNIHKGGIPPVEAGAYLGTVVQRILTYQASGVKLVEKEG